MNLMNQLLGITSFESERLRKLHADGRPLPPMPEPEWVRSQEPTELGMVPLPHVALAGGSSPEWSSPTGMVFMLALSVILLAAGYAPITIAEYRQNGMELIVGGYGLLLFTVIGWFDFRARSSMAPESASIAYAPGDTVLVMLPRRHRLTHYVSAKLLLQERWYVNQDKGGYWKERGLQLIPVTFAIAGANLLTAAITIPDNAGSSYHTTNYRHEWVLAISHVAWWGFTRTDHYLLWIAP